MTIEIEGENVLVSADDVADLTSTTAAPTVRLLPAADPWVMGPGTADPHVVPPARRQLVTTVYQPLLEAGSSTLDTVSSILDHGGSIEATARAMFVHANTVRYRLRRAADITGLTPNDPRDAYTYRLALTLGRLHPPETAPSTVL